MMGDERWTKEPRALLPHLGVRQPHRCAARAHVPEQPGQQHDVAPLIDIGDPTHVLKRVVVAVERVCTEQKRAAAVGEVRMRVQVYGVVATAVGQGGPCSTHFPRGAS